MPDIWQQPWFWPSLIVVVGLPIVLLVLTELIAAAERRRNPAVKLLRFARNFVFPSAAILILLALVGQAVESTDFTWTRIVATVFGFLVIILALNTVNLALFSTAERGSWRERLPSIFIDIGRLVLIIIGLAVLFSVVWDADVGGLFTALGVTSIVIGLALQNAVGSVVSGLLLLFEQPFRLGDWLEVGAVRGRVIEVNWRSVHIDTGNGVQIMPNSSLAGSSFTNLSRSIGAYTVTTTVTFTTDDPPAEVCVLLRDVAKGLPQLFPGTTPSAIPLGGTQYSVSFDVLGPAVEGQALAIFRGWLWYAARRARLGLDGDTTDDFVTAERIEDSVRKVAPTLHLGKEEAASLVPVATLQRFAAGETLLTAGVIPRSVLFILRGTVSLQLPLGGTLLPVTRIDDGDYLGQTALTREEHPTTAIAVTEVAVLVLPIKTVDELVRRRPQLARDFGTVIDRRRGEVEAKVAD